MASTKSNGSQTATISTEHTLATVTDAGNYQTQVDLNAMAKGDVTVIRVKIKPRSGGTTRLALPPFVFSNAQATPIFVTPPLVSPHEYVVTLEQTDGTGRAYPWAIQEP